MTKRSPFRYFKTSPEVIRLAVMLYMRFPLSLRNVEDLLHERGVEISHETVRYWWNRFGPLFASEIRRKRAQGMRQVSRWRWHLDEGGREQRVASCEVECVVHRMCSLWRRRWARCDVAWRDGPATSL